MARIETEVKGGVAVGPAAARGAATGAVSLDGTFGPGTVSRWALIWFALAVAYVLFVTYASSR